MLYFRVGKAESMFVLFAFVKELSAAQLLPLIIAMSKDKVANIKISVATILKVGALASHKEAGSIVAKCSAHNRAWFCVLVYHVNLNAFCQSLFFFSATDTDVPGHGRRLSNQARSRQTQRWAVFSVISFFQNLV